MTVLQSILQKCKQNKGESLVSEPPLDDMLTFKIVHSKKKIGLHSQLFGD